MKARHAQCGATFSGRQEHCPACHLTFSGSYAGDMHRVGDWTEENPRRCRTAAELENAGAYRGEDGVWYSGTGVGSRARGAATPGWHGAA